MFHNYFYRHLKAHLTPGILTSFWVSIGSISSSIIAAISLIICARLLTPEEYGIFAAKFSLLLLLGRIFDLGINLAAQRLISQKTSNSPLSSIFQTGLILKLISWSMCLLICLPFAPLLNHYLFTKIDVNSIRIISVLVFFTLFYDYFLSILQGLHQFKSSNIANISLSTIKLFGVMLLKIVNILSGSTVFWLYGVTSSAISLSIITQLPWGHHLISKSEFTKITKNLLPVIRWTSMAVFAAAITDNADILLIQKFLTNHETGLYAASSRIALFASLIGMSLGTVASVRVAKYKTPTQLKQYLKRATLFALGIPILMLLGSFSSSILIYLTSGPEYLEASHTLSILLIATGIDIAIAPFVALYYLFQKPQYYFYSGLILTITLISSNLIFIPQYGIIGSAIAKLITRLIIYLFTLLYTYRAYHQHKFTAQIS